jgi:hypothetical protein
VRLAPRFVFPTAWLLCLLLSAPAARSAPTDIVPRGDIAYDLLGSLAAAGRLPGRTLADFARGDRLYTRAEMAALIAPVRSADPALALLRRAFAPELGESPGPMPSGLLAGSYKLRGVTGDPDQALHVGRLAGALPVGRDGFAAVSLEP